jgi:ubiquinone/menaquinone biosynthesis C-methylase UbiE
VDVKADILDLPFEDNSFDVIICNHVLEHIIDDKKAMSELYRVMKPKGWGIIQVPMKNSSKKLTKILPSQIQKSVRNILDNMTTFAGTEWIILTV